MGHCLECPEAGARVGRAIGIVLAIIVLIGLCVLLLEHTQGQRFSVIQKVLTYSAWFNVFVRTVGLLPKIKVNSR